MKREFARHAGLLGAYALCAVAFTFPVAFRALAELPDHDPDVRVAVWTQWWFRQAALGPERLNHTSYLFHPDGVDLSGHSHSPLTSAVAAALRPALGEIGAFNVSWLLAFPLGGWGMYLLAHDLTRRRGASFVAGLVWAFAPYHVTQALAHPSLASVEWIPFQVLFLRRSLSGRGDLRAAALAGLSFALSVACGLQIGLLAGLAAVAQVAAALVARREARTARVLRGLALAGLVAIVPALAVLAPLVPAAGGLAPAPDLVLNERLTGQTDVLAWFVPPRLHPLLGPPSAPAYARFAKNRQWMPYLGFVPLALALLAGLRLREARPWLLAGAVIVVCAMGARARIGGAVFEGLPLPWALVDDVLPFSLLRSSDRFNLLLPLPLAALAALALARFRGRWAAPAVALLVGFEYLCAPVPTATAYPDSAALARLAAEGPGTALLDLPMGRQASKHWMLLQTRHRHPLVEGMVARTPPEAYRFIRTLPTLVYLARGAAPPPPDPAGDFRRLAEAGVQHVVVHLDHASPANLARWRTVLGAGPEFADGHLAVFATASLAAAPETAPAESPTPPD